MTTEPNEATRGRLKLSLFMRAVAISATTAGIVAALLSWQAARLTEREAAAAMDRFAAEVTDGLAAVVAPAIRFRKPEDIAEKASELMQRNPDRVRRIIAFDAEGEVFLALPESPDADLEDLHALAMLALEGGSGRKSADGLDVARLILGKDGQPDGGIAISWSNQASAAVIASETFWIRVQAFVVFLVLSVLAAILLRRTISLPLRRLGAAMDRVAAADYGTDVPDSGRGDEIGLLARNLDHMRRALGQADSVARNTAAEKHVQSLMVERLRAAIGSLSRGNLGTRIEDHFAPEYDELRKDLNLLADMLETTLREVVGTASRIRSETDGLSRSTQDLSRRTENQAATLEQSVAAVDELTGSLRSAAEDTRRVAEGVDRTRTQAVEGQNVVHDAVAAMSEIRRSSDQITRITGVIDDIAFQTNLLALNAGVEAARAGEAGRGFSVVASEVRALAQRSSDSAREIKTLIQAAAEEVLKGVELVDRSGAALIRIAEEVDSVAGLANGLASAIADQSAGLSEVSLGLNQLDQVTQLNAGMVEQTATMQRGLHGEAERLAAMVSRFQLDQGEMKDADAFEAAPIEIDTLTVGMRLAS
jgi:methyl-accepting chemotaxis protein